MISVATQLNYDKAYLPFYISFLTVCLILAWHVYGRIQSNIGREAENRAFRRIILVYGIYIIVDFLIIMTAYYTGSRTGVFLLKDIESWILTYFTFSWFRFAEYYLDGFPVTNKRITPLFYIPIIISALSTGVHVWNLLGISGQGQMSPDAMYAVNRMVDFFYLIFAVIHTLYMMLQQKRKSHRQRHYVILECIIYPFVAALISIYIRNVPYIILGILPSILKVLIEMQNANIYTDALTQINNRYRINEYLERNWEHCSIQNPTVMYLIDINKFKKINDKYGHLEGDRALVAVAEALKTMAMDGLVIGRFGGDEFIIADFHRHDPETVKQALRMELKEIVKSKNFTFPLTVSVGYAYCIDPEEKITDVLKRADAMLYEDKKVQGAK
jgi:diguanylate cyclase (GGDEF)-like protein